LNLRKMNYCKAVACVSSLLAIGLLVACGSGMPNPPAIASAAPEPAHNRSWMSPGAKRQDLLYVSDFGGSNVYVYSWPKLTLTGTLTSFGQTGGVCVNKGGDIWIVDRKARDVIEYTHGGTSPIATLSDTYGVPYGCAVDKTTGNLALAIYLNQASSYTRGGVAIYPRASGSPTEYQDDGILEYFFLGYDNDGNLYVDGEYTNDAPSFELAELPKGASVFTQINLPVPIKYPGGVHWDGSSLDLLDVLSVPSTIYEFSISGSDAILQGSTPLERANGDGSYDTWASDFATSKSKVVAPVYGNGGAINIYRYPAGGKVIKSVSADQNVFSAAISEAKRKT
jgi:hypothetical protein